jgi:hypothetical protein
MDPSSTFSGSRWPFLEEERRELAAAGMSPDEVTAEMYEEMRDALKVRFENAPDIRARDKLRWLAGYINETITERQLPDAWRALIPDEPPPQSRSFFGSLVMRLCRSKTRR